MFLEYCPQGVLFIGLSMATGRTHHGSDAASLNGPLGTSPVFKVFIQAIGQFTWRRDRASR